jgi:tetratricopeptide (TPR) repeat protein
MRLRRRASFFMAAAFAALARAGAQIPEKFENLKYFPKDIPRDTLIQVMRGFSFALGVRCQYCHAGGDGISFEGVEFKSDEKPAKRKARYMLAMADTINGRLLAALPDRSDPPVRVACVTCHRGLSKPATLASTLSTTIEKRGTDSAIAQYRRLRENTMTRGLFDFSEWSMNELARTLGERGKTAEAIAMLELNQEFYPQSPSIDMMIAELHRQRGEKDKAIARYRAVLQKEPNNPQAKRRLTELGAQP